MKKSIATFVLLAFNSLFVYGQLGTIDSSFNIGSGFGGIGGSITQSRVEVIVQQPNEQLLVGGWFRQFNGTLIDRLARINLDGSLDNSFNIGTGFNGYVKGIALQSNNKIIVGGGYTSIDGVNRHRIARLNSDGSLDSTFNPLTGFNSDINTVAIQPDGKIIVAGVFSTFDWLNPPGIARRGIARLNADGSLDTSFDPQGGFVSTTGAQTRINKIILQPDGKILACGQFDEFNTVTRIIIARTNADGTLDNSFNAGANFQLTFSYYGEAWDMKLQPDGKILLAGNFDHTGASNSGVVRLNADGSLDNTFSLNTSATAIGLQPNGKIYVSETGPYNFRRHNANGSIDPSFPQTAFNGIVQTIVVQVNGGILIGGWFSYNPSGIMRLIGDNSTISTHDGDYSAANVQVFPNPTSQSITIKIEAQHIKNSADFVLLNSTGQIVKRVSITQSQQAIGIEELPVGMYYYQISNSSLLIATGKLVKN